MRRNLSELPTERLQESINEIFENAHSERQKQIYSEIASLAFELSFRASQDIKTNAPDYTSGGQDV